MASWFERTRAGKRRFIIQDSGGKYVTSLDAEMKGAAGLRDRLVNELDRRAHMAKLGIFDAPPCDWTLEDLLGRVLKLASPQSEAFVRSVHKRLKKGFGADRPIATITRGMIDAYQERRQKEVGNRTINAELLELRRALRLAREDWGDDSFYATDPFRGWKRLQQKTGAGRQRKGHALSPKEQERLLSEARAMAAETTPGNAVEVEQDADMLEVLLLTASRLREVTRMRKEWIRGKHLTFPAHKRGNARTFELTGRLGEIIRKHMENPDPEWVFPSNRSAGPRDQFVQFWKALIERADLPGLRPHDLRHTAITEASERGATEADLMRLAGWKTAQMVANYRAVRQEPMAPLALHRSQSADRVLTKKISAVRKRR